MSLNSKQKTIVIVSMLMFLFMGLYPPWTYTDDHRQMSTEKPAGYALIVEPPEPETSYSSSGVKLDITRLSVQWMMLIVITGCLLFLTKTSKDSISKWDS